MSATAEMITDSAEALEFKAWKSEKAAKAAEVAREAEEAEREKQEVEAFRAEKFDQILSLLKEATAEELALMLQLLSVEDLERAVDTLWPPTDDASDDDASDDDAPVASAEITQPGWEVAGAKAKKSGTEMIKSSALSQDDEELKLKLVTEMNKIPVGQSVTIDTIARNMERSVSMMAAFIRLKCADAIAIQHVQLMNDEWTDVYHSRRNFMAVRPLGNALELAGRKFICENMHLGTAPLGNFASRQDATNSKFVRDVTFVAFRHMHHDLKRAQQREALVATGTLYLDDKRISVSPGTVIICHKKNEDDLHPRFAIINTAIDRKPYVITELCNIGICNKKGELLVELDGHDCEKKIRDLLRLVQ